MATPAEGVYFLNNLKNVVVNQPALTVNQVTNNFNADPHAALRYLYDASARYAGTGHPDAASTCLEGTRETALQDIEVWKRKQLAPESTSEILWLTGGAGTGKSAIAQTTCENFEADGIPVVHCFLSNSSGRTHAAYVFLTIAYQLAVKLSALRAHIEAVVEADPSVVDAPIDKQLQRLILDPITKAGRTFPAVFVIIDGLDECKGEREQIQLIQLIQSTIQGPHPIRFLVASRPELWIRNTLSAPSAPALSLVTLNPDTEADEDIRLFYVCEFKKIRENPENHDDLMRIAPIPWPTDDDLAELVDRASGQFVYAKTVVRFVSDAGCRPTTQLKIVLQSEPILASLSSPLGHLDVLYTRIVSSVANWSLAKIVLGSLSVMEDWLYYGGIPERETLSVMEILLESEMQPGDAYRGLRSLQSLVFVPKDLFSERECMSPEEYRDLLDDESQVPCFLHKSFIDFLHDPQRAGAFYVSREDAHRRLALGCFRILQTVTSTPHTRLFCFTWWYAHRYWDMHCVRTGTKDNQDLLLALNQFSLSSHYFPSWKMAKPKLWGKMAHLRFFEQQDDEALKAIIHVEGVCKALDMEISLSFFVQAMHRWIESQTNISSLSFPKLRLKLRFLYRLRDDEGYI